MATLRELEEVCDALLEAGAFADASYNGIQVDTDRPVGTLATGVTASAAFIREAAAAGADAALVHHGLFWAGQPPVLRGGMLKRIRHLLQNDMGLLAYHLPLDAHAEVGNNACLGRALGLDRLAPWGESGGRAIGVRGELPRELPLCEMVTRIEQTVGREVLAFEGGPHPVRHVAVVSGGAAGMALQAAREGLDLFVTGEPSEPSMHIAAEEGIHFVAAGHHATETLGVRALGDALARELDLEVVHLDLDNPV